MKKYYITGTQGTGKTTVVEELRRRGYEAFDTDTTKLAHWKNIHTGEKVLQRSGERKDWIKSHEWHCDPIKLKELLGNAKGDIFFAGISENQEEYVDLFDAVFLLQCTEETLLHRIATREGHNFGKDEAERNYILGFYKEFEKGFLKRGAVSIDAERTVEEVVDEILSHL